MKTKEEIIETAKREISYTTNLNREFTSEQQEKAKKMVSGIIEECKNWKGKETEEDSYSPFDKLARVLGRARM